MDALYFECHHFHGAQEDDIIVYRITEDRVKDHTLYVLKYAIDEPDRTKVDWKASGSYHYLDQVITEVYHLLHKAEHENGNHCKDLSTDFLAMVTSKIEENVHYIYLYGSRKQKRKSEFTLSHEHAIDFCTLKEISAAHDT